MKFRLLLLFCGALSFRVAATVRYVNAAATGTANGSSWTNAYTSLQTGIGATVSGDTLWVANGVYKPTTTTNINISFQISSGSVVLGGFAGNETLLSQRNFSTFQTILSGDIGTPGFSNDNSRSVVYFSGAGSATRLDGFRIINGEATISSSSSIEEGGGIRLSSSSPTIANCQISDNRADDGGGFWSSGGGNPVFQNCIIQNNTADFGGGGWLGSGTVKFFDCHIQSNVASYNGGAFYSTTGNNLTIDRCTISGNTATNISAVLCENGTTVLQMTNSLVVGNQSNSSVINYLDGASNTGVHKFINNTFAHNKALTNIIQDFAINMNAATTFTNNIVWSNQTASGVQCHLYTGAFVSNNAISGGIGSGSHVNTFTFDPQFINPGNVAQTPFVAGLHNYQLSVASQTIDTGLISAVSPVFPNDLANAARQFGPAPDLGAYERAYCPLPVSISPASPYFCAGTQYTLTASGADNYTWSSGAQTASIQVQNNGSVWVIGTNAAGCRGKATKSVIPLAPTVAIAGPTALCSGAGASLTLTASGSGISYSWSNSQTGPSTTIAAAGTYTVTATDTAGCTAMASWIITVEQPSVPVIVFNNNVLGAPSSYAGYQWKLNGSPIPGATASTHTPATSGSYTVSVISFNGCEGSSASLSVVALGSEWTTSNNRWNLYPNPATNELRLQVTALNGSVADYRLFDLTSKEMGRGSVPATGHGIVDVSGLPAGSYLVEISEGTFRHTIRFSIVR